MQIIETEVIEGHDTKGGFVVEFLGDGGEKVSVHMAQSENGSLNRDNALQKAQVLLVQASRFGATAESGNDEQSEAVESLRQEQQETADNPNSNSALQEGLEDTFPASDPVSASYTSTVASDRKH
ncbi:MULTISPECIES: hypothetical protein [Rhizobium/Agrobacterium group]|uniref:hypothetical protein n=1 Tax=Rhizobium/Agrobacterium group TaxID=227290 RepID=UPI0006B9DC65|nr:MULTISPECIES: hypothetical protein [Rhizobium/Agrobacterium group]AOG08569.1 hypothetical protein BSY240_3417 [Agrobacterium sp. RAC06]KPF60157.1 hypothetical protein IP85_05095 [Rhizobium sp. AAP116]